jgi:Ulp1 family protease
MGAYANNIHIFSTFFYLKLSTGGYSHVTRWTKNIDLFTKDIIIIPINHSQNHWSLYVIVSPGRVDHQASNIEQTALMPNQPFCLYMDSFGYRNIFHETILHYLNQEAKKLGKFSSFGNNPPFDTGTLPCFVPKGKCGSKSLFCTILG